MGHRHKTVALIVAAGSGTRAGGELPKQYARVAGKTVLAHAIDHLLHSAIDEVRAVIGPGQNALYQEAVAGRELPPPFMGGDTRQQSVRNGLEALSDAGWERVLIHDSARPFLPSPVIDRLLQALEENDGAVPVLPVVDSLAAVTSEGLGDATDRDRLGRVQTPQAFNFDAILEAHRRSGAEVGASDDAQVARAAGYKVATVPGDMMLEKLTFSEDFARAEQRLSGSLVARTGLGFDVHALADGEELWLGGLLIPHHRGLKGHSDADVALHALTDALLGAVGAGDIGTHFPPTDPRWRGAPSSRFLEFARDLIEGHGGRIDHVDLTIICEAPKIGPHRAAMRDRIAALLQVPISRVSVKATTTERLGFTGRGEGIAAQAAATIRMPEDR